MSKKIFLLYSMCVYMHSLQALDLEKIKKDLTTSITMLKECTTPFSNNVTNTKKLTEACDAILDNSDKVCSQYPNLAHEFYNEIASLIDCQTSHIKKILCALADHYNLPMDEEMAINLLTAYATMHIIKLAQQKETPRDKDITDSSKTFLTLIKNLYSKEKNNYERDSPGQLYLSNISFSPKKQSSFFSSLGTFILIFFIAVSIAIAVFLLYNFFFTSPPTQNKKSKIVYETVIEKKEIIPKPNNEIVFEKQILEKKDEKKEITLDNEIEKKDPKELLKEKECQTMLEDFEKDKKTLQLMTKILSQDEDRLKQSTLLEHFFSNNNSIARMFFQAGSFISWDKLYSQFTDLLKRAVDNESKVDDGSAEKELQERLNKIKIPKHGFFSYFDTFYR